MIISEILSKKPLDNPANVIACNDSDSVRDAIARLSQHRIGAVVVLSDEVVTGIFTERDVIAGLNRSGDKFLAAPLAEVMVRKVIVVAPSQTVDSALSLMIAHQIRHLPVVDGDKLVGMLSMRDLAMRQLEAVEQTVEFLKGQVLLGSHPLPM
ncbi:MAG: CBS domain-containing protein [bacterium]